MIFILLVLDVILDHFVHEILVYLFDLLLSFLVPCVHLLVKLLIDEQDLVVGVEDEAEANEVAKETQNECHHDGYLL